MSTAPGSSAIELAPGAMRRLVGRYEAFYELGSGGMASVYLARATGAGGFERAVAVKLCHADLRLDPEFSAMFLDEARLAARIHHPNVVGVLDVGDDDDLYLVMEYIEGANLATLRKLARARRGEPLPLPIALRVMVDALAGLHAAHALRDGRGELLRLVHRDVSPQNIIVGVDGVTRITDFGIAKAEARATTTPAGQIKGRFAYMPPEQLLGGPITPRSDIFSAGVVLWETLTDEPLFPGSSTTDTVQALLSHEIAPPSLHRPDLPPGLDAVVLRALARDPDARYETALAFAEALEAAGAPVARPREVSEYLADVLASELERRRAVVRAMSQEPTARDGGAADRTPAPSTSARLRTSRRHDTASASLPDVGRERDTTPPRAGKRYGLAGVGLAAMAALGVAVALRGGGDAARRNAAARSQSAGVDVVRGEAGGVGERAAGRPDGVDEPGAAAIASAGAAASAGADGGAAANARVVAEPRAVEGAGAGAGADAGARAHGGGGGVVAPARARDAGARTGAPPLRREYRPRGL